MGDAILAGANPADALREMLRRGFGDRAGRARSRRHAADGSGTAARDPAAAAGLDGILEQARALLDTAIGQERAELFPDPGDEARMREADLDALPADTAQAIRQLADYDWRSPAARQTFEQLKDLLRSDVLDSQFRGMRQVMMQSRPAGDAAGQGHARRPERDAGRRRPRRAYPGGLRTSSWSGTATCSQTIRRTSRN